MKLLYIAIDYRNYRKKINGQLAAFRKRSIDTYITTYNETENEYQLIRISNDAEVIESYKSTWSRKEYARFVSNVMRDTFYDLVIMRRAGISVIYYGALVKEYKQKGGKFIYEIPTYPIEKRSSVSQSIAQLVETQYAKNFIFPNAVCIPVYCRLADTKLSSKMLPVTNCVNAEEYRFLKDIPLPEYDNTEIKILAIAHCRKWHAFERLIIAMAEWNGSVKLNFTVYGNLTEEGERIKALAEQLNLRNVEFLEEKDVKDYNSFISGFHMAIGCLGIHRKEKDLSAKPLDTSIKNKEYCAMGLPFVHSTEDQSFGNELDFHYLVPDDESPLNIQQILDWYTSVYPKYKSRSTMYTYAVENLSFDDYADKILRYIDK